MAKRYVTRTGKDRDGDITKLCLPSAVWSPRQKAEAIRDIETGLYEYWVNWTKPRNQDPGRQRAERQIPAHGSRRDHVQ